MITPDTVKHSAGDIGLGVIASCLVLLTSGPAFGQAVGAPRAKGTALPVPAEWWTGDLDQMIKRRFIRVLVAHSKTFFFVDRARRAARATT